MLDYISFDATGVWSSRQIYASDGQITNVSINVIDQNVTVAHGTIGLNGKDTKYCAVFSLLENLSMNTGILIDGYGNIWTIMASRELMSIYNGAFISDNYVDLEAFLTRDPSDIVISVPVDVSGTWIAMKGTDLFENQRNDSDIVLSIWDQEDYRIYGTLNVNDNWSIIGIICVSSPCTAEVILSNGNRTIHAMLSIERNNAIVLSLADGDIDGICVFEFERMS